MAELIPVRAGGSIIYVTPDVVKAQEVARQEKVNAFFGQYGRRGTAWSTSYTATTSSVSGSVEKPRDTPNFPFLRAMRKQSMIDQAIITIRLAQMRHVARRAMNPRRQVGWRVRHRYADDPNFENSPELQQRCLQAEAFVEQTLNPMWHPSGLRSALISMVEDELVMDRRAIVYDGLDRKNRPTGWHLVDPASVKPRLDVLLPYMDEVSQRLGGSSVLEVMAQPNLLQQATERASQATGVDLTDAAYVQEVDGRVIAAWKADEIKVDMIYTSTELNRWGYGCSPLEQSLWWSLAFVLAAQYNADLFRQTYPEAVMFLFGDYDPEGLEAFKKQVLGEGATGTNWRLPIIPGGEGMKAEITKLRDTPRDMLFTQWLKMLTSYKAACYRMHPELLNFDLVRGSDQTLFQRGQNIERVSLSQEEGFYSILVGLGDFITRSLVAPAYPDLVWEWVGLDAMTEAEEVQLRIQEMMFSTLGEVRAKAGDLPPLSGEMAQFEAAILNPTIVQMQSLAFQQQFQMMQLQLQQQMAAAQAKAAPPGASRTNGSSSGTKEAPPSAGGRPHRTNQSRPTGTRPTSSNKAYQHSITLLKAIRAGEIPDMSFLGEFEQEMHESFGDDDDESTT